MLINKIKEWRLKQGCSWRRIAELAAEEWPKKKYISGNQIEGRDLCNLAQDTLEEDWEDYL